MNPKPVYYCPVCLEPVRLVNAGIDSWWAHTTPGRAGSGEGDVNQGIEWRHGPREKEDRENIGAVLSFVQRGD